VHEAEGLPGSDMWFGKGRRPDAYVRIVVVGPGGQSSACNSNAWPDSGNPLWGFCCDLSISNPIELGLLRIEVREMNQFFGDHNIGECKLTPAPRYMEWCELHSKRHKGEKDRGRIKLSLMVRGPGYNAARRLPPAPPWAPEIKTLPSWVPSFEGVAAVSLGLCTVLATTILIHRCRKILKLKSAGNSSRRFARQVDICNNRVDVPPTEAVPSHNYDNAKMLGMIAPIAPITE